MKCNFPGCDTLIRESYVMCYEHWTRLSEEGRKHIRAAAASNNVTAEEDLTAAIRRAIELMGAPFKGENSQLDDVLATTEPCAQCGRNVVVVDTAPPRRHNQSRTVRHLPPAPVPNAEEGRDTSPPPARPAPLHFFSYRDITTPEQSPHWRKTSPAQATSHTETAPAPPGLETSTALPSPTESSAPPHAYSPPPSPLRLDGTGNRYLSGP